MDTIDYDQYLISKQENHIERYEVFILGHGRREATHPKYRLDFYLELHLEGAYHKS